MTTTSTNYSGRTKDLFISYGADPTKTGLNKITYSFGTIANVIAGVQKLAQRYSILLFNTGLVQSLQNAKGRNLQEATHIFNFANWAVLQTIKTYQTSNPDLPADEQLANAQLNDLSVSAGKVHLTIQLTTKAGTGYAVLLPIALS